MKTATILCLLALTSFAANAQTDTEIVHVLLGKSWYKVNNALDSMGIWYYHHFHENKSVKGKELKPKIYSIANGVGSVKVFMLDIHPVEKYVQKITINYRHDSREQVEDLKKMWTGDDFHVGTYSTDITFKSNRP